MSTVSTTYFFMTDARATDRTDAPLWNPWRETSATHTTWMWSPAPRS